MHISYARFLSRLLSVALNFEFLRRNEYLDFAYLVDNKCLELLLFVVCNLTFPFLKCVKFQVLSILLLFLAETAREQLSFPGKLSCLMTLFFTPGRPS